MKPNRPSYDDMIDLPEDPVEPTAKPKAEPATVTVPAPTPVAEPVQPALKDGTPTAYVRSSETPEDASKAETVRPARRRKESSVPSRREAARLRRMEPKPEPADYAQRSLYAREETFERFRQLAFTNKTAAQALYREGLYLVLKKYGAADGLTQDDM